MLWVGAGWGAFGLGLVGAALPLLPTVPFMLLAAFCFARGSARFHRWLVEHPRFGPAIRSWRAHGAISRDGKRWALVGIFASFTVSFILGVSATVIAIQAATLGCVALFVLTRPEGPGDEG